MVDMRKKAMLALALTLFSSFILLQSSTDGIDIITKLFSEHGIGGY